MARKPSAAGNYLSVPIGASADVINGLARWTAGAWVRVDSLSNGTAILSSQHPGGSTPLALTLGISDATSFGADNEYVVGFYTGGIWRYVRSGVSLAPRYGTWAHVVGSFSGGELRLYIDGKNAGSTVSVAGYATSASMAFYIGKRWDGSTVLNGAIQDAFVASRAFVDAEVLALYANGGIPQYWNADIKGYWPLDTPGKGIDLSANKATADEVGSVLYEQNIPRIFAEPLDQIIDYLPPNTDAATVYLDLSITSVETYGRADSGTVLVDLQASGVDEYYVDAATALIDLQVFSTEQYFTPTVDSGTVYLDLVAGQRPSNDNIGSPHNFGSNPADQTITGTTVGATQESFETYAGYPSVWYRFTATANTTKEITIIKTGGDPGWFPYIEVYRINSEPPTSYSQLTYIDYAGANNALEVPLSFATTAGESYMFWLANWNTGVTADEGDFKFVMGHYADKLDSATLALKLTPSGVEDFHPVNPTDEATVYLDLKITYVEGGPYSDSATILLELTNLGGECHSTFTATLLGEGEAETDFASVSDLMSMIGDDELGWDSGAVLIEGINC